MRMVSWEQVIMPVVLASATLLRWAKSRRIVIAESFARIIAAVRITSIRWWSYARIIAQIESLAFVGGRIPLPKHRN